MFSSFLLGEDMYHYNIYGATNTTVAVSYTHLDVYKRQGQSHTVRGYYCNKDCRLISLWVRHYYIMCETRTEKH